MTGGRRAFLAAVLAGGIGASTVQPVRGYLDRLAPLSGSVWDAATASVSGEVTTPYGDAPVRYDDRGVPTVEAADDPGLYFAVGYVHAADRLFQLDLIRRRTRGELAAVFGEQTVGSDVFSTQMDFASAAGATLALAGTLEAALGMGPLLGIAVAVPLGAGVVGSCVRGLLPAAK